MLLLLNFSGVFRDAWMESIVWKISIYAQNYIVLNSVKDCDILEQYLC